MRWRSFSLVCLLLAVAGALAGAWIGHVERPGASPESLSIGGGAAKSAVVDFGAVYYGQTASRLLDIDNDSDHSVLLSGRTSCGCTQVRILNPAVPPGGRSKVVVSYSGINPSLAGPASEEFMIFRMGRSATQEVRGSVKAFVLRSLRFNRSDVYWHYLPASTEISDRSVTAENVSSHTIRVAWLEDLARPLFFKVSPRTATIAPGAEEAFVLQPSAALSHARHPEAAAVVLKGAVELTGRVVPLRFTFHVYSLPEPVLQAIPGAIVVSPDAGGGRGPFSITLVPGFWTSKPPQVVGVTTNSPRLLAVLRGHKVLVSLDLAHGQRLFQGHIAVAYTYNGIKSAIDVPIFSAPGAAAPAEAVAGAARSRMGSRQ